MQEKGIAYPTDSKLYDKAHRAVVNVAHKLNITLRQTYRKLVANA